MTYWPDGTPEEDQPIWDRYRGRCVICFDPAVCLHESPPKSLRPRTWRQFPQDRFPVCDQDHRSVQHDPDGDRRCREGAKRLLRMLR